MNTRLTSRLILALTLGSMALSSATQASMQNQTTQAISASVSANELDLQAQISHNIKQMLAKMPNKVEKAPINQLFVEQALALQTDDLVKEFENQIPKFKFKVVLAD